LFVTVALKKLASRELDAGVEASGPHDFTVLMLREQSKPWTSLTGGILSNVAKRQQSSMFKVFGFVDTSQYLKWRDSIRCFR
jgi:hypothetical protein